MSKGELSRLEVLRDLGQKRLTTEVAAQLLGLERRQVFRLLMAARRGLGPNVELMIDAHGSREVATAIKLAKKLEPYDIAWFEEPVSPDDHAGQAEVRRSTVIDSIGHRQRGNPLHQLGEPDQQPIEQVDRPRRVLFGQVVPPRVHAPEHLIAQALG
jgi:hypothetical protein